VDFLPWTGSGNLKVVLRSVVGVGLTTGYLLCSRSKSSLGDAGICESLNEETRLRAIQNLRVLRGLAYVHSKILPSLRRDSPYPCNSICESQERLAYVAIQNFASLRETRPYVQFKILRSLRDDSLRAIQNFASLNQRELAYVQFKICESQRDRLRCQFKICESQERLSPTCKFNNLRVPQRDSPNVQCDREGFCTLTKTSLL